MAIVELGGHSYDLVTRRAPEVEIFTALPMVVMAFGENDSLVAKHGELGALLHSIQRYKNELDRGHVPEVKAFLQEKIWMFSISFAETTHKLPVPHIASCLAACL
jgi:hypothetical protein